MHKAVMNVIFLAIGVLFSAHAFAQTNNIVVTPGSAAAYVFCPKPKSSCKVSSVGRWMFKLQHEDNVVDATKKPDAFRDTAGFVGSSGSRLLWNSGTASLRVIDRVYVGYGEFKIDTSDPTKGTFSGIVDMPPIAAPGGCPAYTNYCSMSGSTGAVTADTPYRTCNTTYSWTSSGPIAVSGTNWNPNTGVIECKNPLGTFGTNFGNGIGNCVAQYVQRRGSSFPLGAGYYSTEYIYQARVYNLQIREAFDFADASCTAVSY